ncbi:MAG: segregation/condensation protein A [Clostridia bacterium]
MENTNEEQLDLFSDKDQFKLENFEGPLDLLLHLIKEAKLDIATVKISEITEQYLEILKDIDNLDMDKASDFIVMASTLIEIKSKQILPVVQEDNSEEESSEELLLRQLKEYKIFKEASEELRKIEDINRLWRAPDESAGNVKVVLKDMALDSMLNAFAMLLQKAALKETVVAPKQINKDRFTVAEKIAAIKDAIMIKPTVEFETLFEEEQTKSEIIAVFLAILELLKMQIITVKQNEIFGKIEIHKNEGESANGKLES